MKRIVSALMALVLVLGTVVIGVGFAEDEATYIAGTYDGVGFGMGGQVKVSVTFSEDKILDIKIGENNETAFVSEPALTRIPKDILQFQSLNVDMVTGATVSSRAVIAAVSDAVKQADGDVEALANVPIPLDEIQNDETVETDILVVGSGVAGMMAAFEAAEKGKDVLLIEKLETFGGSSALSAGAVCYATEEEDPVGYFSKEEYANWMIKQGHGKINETLVRRIVDLSDDTVRIMRNIGFDPQYEMTEDLGDGLYSRMTNPLSNEGFIVGGGSFLSKAFYDKISSYPNVTILNRTRAEKLLIDSLGNVVGAIASKQDTSKLTINAGAVILATGGFDRGEIFWERLAPGLEHITTNISCIGNEGDGILLCEEIGAKLILDAPAFVGGSLIPSAPIPENYLLVNGEGNRFTNEVNNPSYLLAEVYRKNGTGINFAILDASLAGETLGEAVEQGKAFKADSIEELAESIGINPVQLGITVDRYNALKGQADSDFGKATEYMTGIGQAPFYAVSFTTMNLTSYAGPVVTDNCEVVSEAGDVIPGLYAVGEFAAVNYTSYDGIGHGMSLQDAMGTGRIAAWSAIEYID